MEGYNPKEFQQKVNELYSRKEYRPVGVSVLYDNVGRFLVLESSKAANAWSFPQGGIDLGETLQQNQERELFEETGIVIAKDIRDPKWAYLFETLDAESTRADKRGFTRGKAYFYNLARYVSDKNLTLQADEIANARFAEPKEAIGLFNLGRPEKARISINALEKALQVVGMQCGGK